MDTATTRGRDPEPRGADRPSPTSSRRRRLTTLSAYTGLLVAAVIAFASHEWGTTWHSVASLAVLGVIIWHVSTQRRWLKSALRRRRAHPERALIAYNALLATVFTVATLTGLLVWIWGIGGLVLQVHDITGIAFVPLVIGHLILNRRRLGAKLRRRSPRAPAVS